MSISLQHKKCFITGAASGIGRATAIACAAEGAELFLTDINASQLDEVASLIRSTGGRVKEHRALDIANLEAVQAFANTIHSQYGSMDIVMNIAGISIWGSVDTLEHQHWQRLVNINLMGPIHVIETFIPPMIRAGKGGCLVNVSSAAGLFGLPLHAAYSATKFGLRGISEVLRYDLKQHGIHVCLVCPGGVDTGLVRTIEIVGVDRNDPDIQKLTGRFQKHAVSPEKAAAAIIKGIKSKRYMVYTSLDIAFGHWWQRKFAWPYEVVMQLMNNYLSAALKKSKEKNR